MWPLASPLSSRSLATISDSYDFIIVGGGTAGLVLAARLSEDSNTTVLVLEGGHSGDDVVGTIDIPDNTYYDSLTGTEYDYAYVTASQSNMNGRGLSWPRGKVLGGSSAINGMYHVRPAKVEVEAWQSLIAAEGDSDAADNWSWDSFFAAMKKSETFTAPSDDAESVAGITYDASLHGTDGPIHVSYPGFQLGLNGNWTSTLGNAGISQRTDGAGGENWGAYVTQSFINPTNWTRSYSRNAYIDPLPPRSNLDILADAMVTRIVFKSDSNGNLTATGVEYAASAGAATSSVSVNKEVVLTAGVIGSAQVLMVSGVGPQDVLESAGVDVQYALPGVGQHLQDHLVAAIYWSTEAETAGNLHANGLTTAEFTSYINSATAYVNLASIMGETAANTLVSSIESAADSSASLVPSQYDEVKQGYRSMYSQAVDLLSTEVGHIELLLALTGDGAVGIQAGLQHPFSPGHLYINSSSVFDYPVIDPGYLSHSADLTVLREGAKLARTLGQTEPLSQFLGTETTPVLPLVEEQRTTEYHPRGSCSMLPQSQGGVVNGKLQVYGTTNVRVADSSIFPIDMSCHLEAPTIGVAEKAAEIIRTQYNVVKSGSSTSTSDGSSNTIFGFG
ncbi:GMC oxidoreductase [Mucidula mucida]|nr:GMC oxidoreductase [Mucidula mucida]